MKRIHVIDTHTGGEPTRVVMGGGPDLGDGSLAERAELLRNEFDHFRRSLILEPRGSDVLVGALICEPVDPAHTAGVIFFNNVGVLGMCGHGTIGVAVALAHAGMIDAGRQQFETPVGLVDVQLHPDGQRVTLDNVPSYRLRQDVTVSVPGHGSLTGDVAWGGNWFFLVSDHGQRLASNNVGQLTEFTQAIRRGLESAGITGADGAEIDHVELFGPSENADSRNFVLCPGGAYDRSPCGTGTSAKVACLAADGVLEPGQTWRQESIVGSLFEAQFRRDAQQQIIPRITGSAWVTADAQLLFDDSDPFAHGISHG